MEVHRQEDQRHVDRGQTVGEPTGQEDVGDEPSSAPSDPATSVSGQRKPFAAKITLSPPTTAAATATRRSVRFMNPAYSRYPCTTRWRTKPPYG